MAARSPRRGTPVASDIVVLVLAGLRPQRKIALIGNPNLVGRMRCKSAVVKPKYS